MNSPNAICAVTSSHQAIMKCPWQWRQPFLDEKLASRKRKVGDGYFYDPVDPSFVDHLLPGYAKKVCESDEKEKIQLEIQRLMLKKEERAAGRLFFDALVLGGSALTTKNSAKSAATASDAAASDDDNDSANTRETNATAAAGGSDSASDVSQENLALVDSILLMTKAVDESSLLASPKSVSSPLSPVLEEDEEEPSPLSLSQSASDERFEAPLFASATSLELVSDNLQENFFASEDSDLLDFPTASASG